MFRPVAVSSAVIWSLVLEFLSESSTPWIDLPMSA